MVTEIHEHGRVFAGSGANWCDACNTGKPQRVEPLASAGPFGGNAYSASLVANAFLHKAKEAGVQLTHMRLQKLVFFVHAWGLALKGVSPVSVGPQAWPHGPVFELLYYQLKSFGIENVTAYLLQMNPASGVLEPQIPARSDADFWSVLDQVWVRYAQFSDSQLSALSGEPGSPWHKARQECALNLCDREVRDFFRAKLPAPEAGCDPSMIEA